MYLGIRMKKKLLITGGSGTIARAFLHEYYDEYEFYCFARNERHLAEVKRDFPNVSIRIGNVEDKEQLFYFDLYLVLEIIFHTNLIFYFYFYLIILTNTFSFETLQYFKLF